MADFMFDDDPPPPPRSGPSSSRQQATAIVPSSALGRINSSHNSSQGQSPVTAAQGTGAGAGMRFPQRNTNINNITDEPTHASTTAGVDHSNDGGANAQVAKFKNKLIAILDSQSGVMAFLLYVAFAFLVTGGIDWTGSFALFAVAVRMLVHVAVSLQRVPYSDVVCCVIGIAAICLGLPFVDSTPGAGITGYLLLVLPWYTEEALVVNNNNSDRNGSNANDSVSGSNDKVAIYRRRAVQFVGLFSPIALAIYVFFQVHGGLLFHIVALAAVAVFILSYILRALNLGREDELRREAGQQQQQADAAANNNDENSIPAFDGSTARRNNAPTPIAPSATASHDEQEMHDINDPVAPYLNQIRAKHRELESSLKEKSPGAYQVYLHTHKPYTTAVSAIVITLILVLNVGLYEPDHYEGGKNNNSTTPSGNAVPSAATTLAVTSGPPPSQQQQQTLAPPTQSPAPPPSTARAPNEGGGANPDRPFDGVQGRPVYATHYYISVGLLSAFILFAVEMLAVAFLDSPESPFQLGWFKPRFRRFAILGFAFVLAFFPASWKMYPAAVALAAVVPWIVWRDASSHVAELAASENNNSSSSQRTAAAAARNAVPDSNSLAVDSDPYQVPSSSAAGEGGTTTTLLSDQQLNDVIVDFLLPTVVTALMIVLSTGAEDKKPATFIDFVAVLAHGAMSYFLFVSLKNFNNERQEGGEAAAGVTTTAVDDAIHDDEHNDITVA